MTDLLRLLIVVPLGYIVAVLAAGTVISFGLFGGLVDIELVGFFVGGFLVISMYAGGFSFVPALIAVLLAEAFAWRSVFYYIAIGGLIGLANYLLSGMIGELDFAGRRLALYLAAGFIGGFVYWLIAGRTAGPGRSAPAAPQSGPA